MFNLESPLPLPAWAMIAMSIGVALGTGLITVVFLGAFLKRNSFSLLNGKHGEQIINMSSKVADVDDRVSKIQAGFDEIGKDLRLMRNLKGKLESYLEITTERHKESSKQRNDLYNLVRGNQTSIAVVAANVEGLDKRTGRLEDGRSGSGTADRGRNV